MLALVAVLLSAQPTSTHTVANEHLARAIDQVQALDEQAALLSLAEARKSPTLSAGELALVHLYEGLAHAGLANGPDAIAAFHAARLLEPSLTLPAEASPRVREWWAQAAPGTAPEARATLEPLPTVPEAPPPQLVEPTPVAAVSPVPGWAPYAAAGAAVVAAAGGIWSGIQASSHAQAANDAAGIAAASDLRRRAEREALTANLLYGGAVLLGGGAAFLWVVRF